MTATLTTVPPETAETKRLKLADDIQCGLPNWIGTQSWWPNFTGIKYTDGVKWLAEKAHAYWLIDVVGSHWATSRKVRAEGFVLCRLTVDRDPKAKFMARFVMMTDCEPDGETIVVQRIPYTDFPLDEIELYLCDGVLMLPNEY